MPKYRALVHSNGPALWPEHKSTDEILRLKDETPILIWEGTYQGRPSPTGGYTFRQAWWKKPENRYHLELYSKSTHRVMQRYLSFDTASTDNESSAYTAGIVVELLVDYRLIVRHVWRDRVTFPDLPPAIEQLADQFNTDGKLVGIVIEDKSTGTSAYQTLMRSTNENVRGKLIAFQPSGDKATRGGQAAVWCKNDSVLFPHPGPLAPWLIDFEDELFSFPQGAFADQVDAFSQIIIYLEYYLSAGFEARRNR